MTRERWPYQDDRDVLDRFLAGRLVTFTSVDTVSEIIDGTYRCCARTQALMWYDSVGALCASLDSASPIFYEAAAVEYAASQLGMTDARITREEVAGFDPDTGRRPDRFRYFFGDTEILSGVPFIMCGPMTVLAYRAGLKVEDKP